MSSHDLFSWRDEADAAAQVAAAEAARQAAEARFRRAPHGEVKIRLQGLVEATSKALQAEVELQRLQARDRRP